MRRRPLSANYLLGVAALICCCFAPAQIARNASASEDRLITVMNPAVSDRLAARVPLAPRLDALQGKTIYLVDTNYEGMGRTPVLEEMQAWFARSMPDVKVIFKLKKGNYVDDDPGLWKEMVSNKANGIIIGVAG